ncbi:T9SS-dependent choice-of-anchor J family protein [Hymenobacter terricola]|uniref:T9SS-dependent choice-of-anchor J family protein n=1 Tax=Hymenobacter terricola TaxID=2819236 RepID=UPI001B3143E7|nr:choice-of-anchor J domain-containing protein [Hymenobacter terricola]
MNHQYNRLGRFPRLRYLAMAALLACGATTAKAQFYVASNVANLAGTYTDLGTTGTALTTANFDDANAASAPIGFTFTYGGTAFTDFVLNTNGYLKLGTAAPVAPFFSTYAQEAYTSGPLNSTTDNNLILPFNTDLEAGTGTPEYRVATTGTAPNRVCTIQWKNVSDKTRAASSAAAGNIDKQFSNFSFQVKLYETSNRTDFVYGTATPSTNPTNANFIVVGVKGAGTGLAQVVTAVKASNTSWSGTVFQQGVYTSATNAHNIRAVATVAGSTPLPDPGRTYSFVLPTPNDAAVQIIYSYDKVAVPVGQPFTIQAIIRNAGTAALSNVVASLNVTGANTFTAAPQTVASLAVGATALVTFPNVTVPNIGNNTVTVSVPNDDNNTNNNLAVLLETSATTFSYRTASAGSGNSVFSAITPNNYYAAKITLNASRNITAVTGLISEAGTSATSKTSVGESVYGVVVNATTGAILGRSADYVITAADINAQHTFTLSAPVTVPAGDVLIGMAQVPTASTTANFYPYGVQNEVPTRPNTFFTGSIATPAAPTAFLNTATTSLFKFPFEAVTAPLATCPQPTAFVRTGNTSTSVSFSFTASTGSTGYQIVYGPQGFTPSASSLTSATFTGTTYTLPGLTAGTTYDFYVRSICSATDQSGLTGPITASTACAPPTISTFPYTQNFDVVATGQTLPCGITVTDSNTDGFTWQPRGTVDPSLSTTNVSRSAPNAMVYVYNTNDASVGANDWFYTPALALSSTQRYRVSFYYRVASGFPEKLEVKYGTAATPAGQTTTLFTNSAVTNTTYSLANNVSTPAVLDITPTTGTYYVGFHAFSLGNQGFLAVDDLSISAGPLATSEALMRAVSVFPNPSTSGVFNLEIHGANAKQALGVEVTNMLGQRVYTGTAKDNLRTDLDLSSLAPGIYNLKVRNGQEYTQQQIAIVK